jgi:hypothetical protein
VSELTIRYYRARRGCLDVPVSDSAKLLDGWLLQSPSRDVVPGLLRIAPGAVGEVLDGAEGASACGGTPLSGANSSRRE